MPCRAIQGNANAIQGNANAMQGNEKQGNAMQSKAMQLNVMLFYFINYNTTEQFNSFSLR